MLISLSSVPGGCFSVPPGTLLGLMGRLNGSNEKVVKSRHKKVKQALGLSCDVCFVLYAAIKTVLFMAEASNYYSSAIK